MKIITNNMTRILTIALAVLIAACGGNKGGDKKAELADLKKQETEITKKIKALEAELGVKSETADKVKLVRTEDVQPKSFTHYIDIQGRIDASENVVVNVRNQGGMITKIYVKEGQAVKAGQILAETDASAYLANVEALRVQLQTAATVYEKQKKLWDQKIGTEIQFIQAKATKESLEKNIAALQEQIDMTKITAPISGTIDEVMIKIGQMASPSIPNNGIRIVNMNSLKVKADIAESYARNVKNGNDVIINFPDIDKEITSNITYVGKNINQLTRTFGVEASLGNQEDYHPNMIAVLKIADYKAENVLVIPINILQNSEDGQFVFIAAEKGGKLVATKRVVTVGKTSGNYVEVVSGLTKGEKIITIGYQDLNEGDEVKI
jgi:RND family efflux transporter MFP subunit